MTVIENRSHLTNKKARMSYHRDAFLLLAKGFSCQQTSKKGLFFKYYRNTSFLTVFGSE
jgi:hypothetical protein